MPIPGPTSEGLILFVSLAVVLPFSRPSTLVSWSWIDAGSISSEAPHLNIRRMRSIWRLMYFLDQSSSSIFWRHAFKRRGPNSLAGVSP